MLGDPVPGCRKKVKEWRVCLGHRGIWGLEFHGRIGVLEVGVSWCEDVLGVAKEGRVDPGGVS